MERLQRIFGQTGMGQPGSDSPLLDSSEQVYISSLALLKMLKHGQSPTLTLTVPPLAPSSAGARSRSIQGARSVLTRRRR
jgi:hypothetical protein